MERTPAEVAEHFSYFFELRTRNRAVVQVLEAVHVGLLRRELQAPEGNSCYRVCLFAEFAFLSFCLFAESCWRILSRSGFPLSAEFGNWSISLTQRR